MSKTSNTTSDSNGKDPKEPRNGSANKRRNRSNREGKSVSMCGLALVEFEVKIPHDTDNGEKLLTDFYDLKKFEDLPRPRDLLKLLLEDKVFEDKGEMLGEVPMKRYVEEGLFLCSEMSSETDYGPSPYIGIEVTPNGIEWLLENYGPSAERHLSGLVPEKLQGRKK